MEVDLTAWGKAITLETVGRRSGRPRRVTIGFVEASGGVLLVAGSSRSTQWTLNLMAQPLCHVQIDGRWMTYRAEILEEGERNTAISGLILKYGTPAEQLGAGPAFRLVPVVVED